MADDSNDRHVKLPLITLSRNKDIELLLNVKNPRSYDGLKLKQTEDTTVQLNVIPIKLVYQLDIYTKTNQEANEYLRQYLFKLINNPLIKLIVPYNGQNVPQTANIRVLSTVSETSDIPQHLFQGQFTRWTIQLELQDAFLYDIPYRKNWKICIDDDQTYQSLLEVVNDISGDDYVERELLEFNFKKADGQ